MKSTFKSRENLVLFLTAIILIQISVADFMLSQLVSKAILSRHHHYAEFRLLRLRRPEEKQHHGLECSASLVRPLMLRSLGGGSTTSSLKLLAAAKAT